MNYPALASAAVKFYERIPSVVWAAWILTVLVVTGVLAMRGGPTG
jgi:hypothetical protein